MPVAMTSLSDISTYGDENKFTLTDVSTSGNGNERANISSIESDSAENLVRSRLAIFFEASEYRYDKFALDEAEQQFGTLASSRDHENNSAASAVHDDRNKKEQQIVDCATQGPYDNHGCNGGYASRALGYIKDHGQTTESKYPYKAVNQDCQVDSGEFKTFGVAEISGCSSI